MSLSLFRVRARWEEEAGRQQQQERRLAGILVLLLVATTLALSAVEALRPYLPSLAWRDSLLAIFSLGVYLAGAVWLALQHRPGAFKIAALTLLVAAVAIVLGNGPLKAGIPTSVGQLKYGDQVTAPRAAFGVAFLLVWLWLAWLCRRYPQEMRAAGIVGDRLGLQLLVGFLAGLLLVGHAFFSNSYSQALSLNWRGWPYYLWHVGYEAGLQTWAEELFFRGFLLSYLLYRRHWGFWRAAIVSSALNLLLYLPEQQWRQDLIIIAAVVFYVFITGMVYATLYRLFRSVWPSFVANTIFDCFAFLI